MILPNAADIRITSSLINDYLQLEDAPVGDNLEGRFVAVQDADIPGVCNLITVDPAGELVHFTPDASSHSGWALLTVDVKPPPNTRLQPSRLAAYSQGGIINLLTYFPAVTGSGSGAVWMQYAPSNGWSQAGLGDDAGNALGYTFQTDTYVDPAGNQYLYGVTGAIDPDSFYLVASVAGQFDVIWEQPLEKFDPPLTNAATFRLMPALVGDSFTVLWVDAGVLHYQGASVADGNFAWAGTGPRSVQLGADGLAVAQVLAMPGRAGSGSLFAIGTNTTLYLILDYNGASPSVTALSGQANGPAGVSSATVGLGQGGLLVLFAVETTTRRLWVLRQTAESASGAPVFAPWVALGNQIGAISAPAMMQAGAEVFVAGLDQTVSRMTQAASDMVWSLERLAAPTASTTAPKSLATYSMHLTVLTAQQTPLGGAIVTVTADRPVTIVAEELSHQIGPNTPGQLPVDATGTILVAARASDFTPPIVTFTVANADGSKAQRWCHGDVAQLKQSDIAVPPSPQSVANRLAGKDPGKPITVATLSAAGLISPKYGDPSGAVSAVTSAGQWMRQNPQETPNGLTLEHVEVRHWRLSFTDPAGPRFEVLNEAQGLECLTRARSPQDGEGGSAGFLGDILNFFKYLWDKLEEISAHLVDDVLHLVINDVKWIVKTLRQAADALSTVFNRIIGDLKKVWQAIVDVVEFIMQLFEWDDTLLTHRVIKSCINSLLTTAVAQMGQAEDVVAGWFNAVETNVANVFDDLEQHFEQRQTFNNLADAQPPTPAGGSGHALGASTLNTGYAQNGTRCNYVHSRTKTYFGSGGGRALLAGTALARVGDTAPILSEVQQHWAGSHTNTATTKLQNFVTGTITDAHSFFDLVMLDLLIAAKDLVLLILEGLEDITLAVMQAAVDAVTGLQATWNTTIEIPVISWLYKHVITNGEDLTILDVLCLIFAVPGTILYKIMHDGAPPFSNTPAVQKLITNGLPWPQIGGGSVIAVQDAGISADIIELLGVVAGVAAFFGTFITLGNDLLVFIDDPLPGLPTFLSWTSVIQGVASQALGAPFSQFASGAGNWTTADSTTVGLWCGSLVPLLYDSVFSVATGKLAKYTPELGPVLDTGVGAALTGIAIWTIVEQRKQGSPYTGWDAANSLVPQLGRAFKFLLLTKNTEAAPAAAVLTGVLDVVLGVGATVTQIGDAIEG